jgi:hypothetical protein
MKKRIQDKLCKLSCSEFAKLLNIKTLEVDNFRKSEKKLKL